MPQATLPVVRPVAPAIASNDASTPTTTDAVRLHLLAVNGLTEALHALRHGDLSPEAMHRAIGKARRGTTALKRLAAQEGSAA